MNEPIARLFYKGYVADVSQEDECYHGKVEDVHFLMCFDGEDLPELYQLFTEAVDDYEAICKPIFDQKENEQ